MNFTFWDIGGRADHRPYWGDYGSGADAIIFVVDSSDPSRYEEALRELEAVLKNPKFLGIPLLIMANKQDKGFKKTSAGERAVLFQEVPLHYFPNSSSF